MLAVVASTSGAGHNLIASAQLGLCPKPPGEYKEEQLRLGFLNGPCPTIRRSGFGIRTSLESLGREVSSKAGLSEVLKPSIQEPCLPTASRP